MGVSSYNNSQASYSTGGGQWTCASCGAPVVGSHICFQGKPPVPNFVWPPISELNNAEMRELLELVRELHSVIFRRRMERDIEKTEKV